jgi:hypothetical protein
VWGPGARLSDRLGAGGVVLLRELLRELTGVGRRDVSIVVHRVD